MDESSVVGYQEFTEWERRLVKEKAREKIGRLKRPAIDREDLEQEFLLHLWLKRPQYDPNHPSKASLKTFLNHLLDRKFLDIVKFENQDRRAIHGLMDSLDQELSFSEDEDLTLGGLIPEYQQFHKRKSDLSELCRALDEATSKLTAIQRTIFKLLSEGHGIADISKRLRKPWSSLKREVTKMRTAFYDAGLEDFVDFGDSPKKRRMGK